MRITERDLQSAAEFIGPWILIGFIFGGWQGAWVLPAVWLGTLALMMWPAYIYWIYRGIMRLLKKRY